MILKSRDSNLTCKDYIFCTLGVITDQGKNMISVFSGLADFTKHNDSHLVTKDKMLLFLMAE